MGRFERRRKDLREHERKRVGIAGFSVGSCVNGWREPQGTCVWGVGETRVRAWEVPCRQLRGHMWNGGADVGLLGGVLMRRSLRENRGGKRENGQTAR